MMAINPRDAERQGYEPDSTVCASDVPAGRPYPYMCLQNVINLRVWPVEACVKIDDTLPGIEEGRNANALPDPEKHARRQRAYDRMRMEGAHYVVDTIADVLPCFDDIEARLARSEKP